MSIVSIQPHWPAASWIHAHTTVREHWGKPENQIENNDHLHTNIAATQQLVSLLALPSDPCWVTQKHTAHVIPAQPHQVEQIADATFTASTQRVCAILTADCLPVFFCDKAGSKVAVVHAGWRGLANGILEATIDALALPSENLLVALGPAIGPQKFEVGNEVYDAYVNHDHQACQAFIPLHEGKWLANLYALARLRLSKKGVSQIYGGDLCTYTQENLFFSYRRDQGKTGRMASVIWMDPAR